ncbi:MAG: nucleotidyltransferase domain-containing protein [Kiritimatiellae bacterium]|nr:nucleotidyltransferase domain-containing protein [Kiritimatiellia bacterium]
MRTDRLPQQYQEATQALLSKTLRIYPRTVAFVVIGSVADGTCKPDSDLDVVWIHRGKRKRHWYDRVDYDYDGPIELVVFNLKQVRNQFRQHSPMAHALQSGLVLYDPERLHAGWMKTSLGLPTRHWIDTTYAFMSRRLERGIDSFQQESRFHRRFCRQAYECHCAVSDVLCRAVWNLVRLILVVQGHVPMSKLHTRQLFLDITRGSRLHSALDATILVHHEKRFCRIEEAREMVYLGRWACDWLRKSLGEPTDLKRSLC